MRPQPFDAQMRKRGWVLKRICANGHHVSRHAHSGVSLTLDPDNDRYADSYLARYAQRDTCSATKIPWTPQERESRSI